MFYILALRNIKKDTHRHTCIYAWPRVGILYSAGSWRDRPSPLSIGGDDDGATDDLSRTRGYWRLLCVVYSNIVSTSYFFLSSSAYLSHCFKFLFLRAFFLRRKTRSEILAAVTHWPASNRITTLISLLIRCI